MWRLLLESVRHGVVTCDYPRRPDVPPDAFRGLPVLDPRLCTGCGECAIVCPTRAIQVAAGPATCTWDLSVASCLLCGLCAERCEPGALTMGREFELAARQKQELLATATFVPAGSESREP